MAAVETLRSLVNTWECDENAHMNIQFYFVHFDTAARHFLALAGLDEAMLGPRRVRHVRYHSELRAAELIVIRSAIAPDGPHPVTIVHEMIEPVSGRLSATAIDGYEGSGLAMPPAFFTPLPDVAAPRSFKAAPVTAAPTTEALVAAGGVVAFRGAIHPRHCDAAGEVLDQTYISAFNDGVSHAWEAGGIETRWLRESGYGRVALELKLSRVASLRQGELIHMVSCCAKVERKAFSFRHHLFETHSGRLVAVGEATGIVMDLATRKSVILPERIMASLQALAGRLSISV